MLTESVLDSFEKVSTIPRVTDPIAFTYQRWWLQWMPRQKSISSIQLVLEIFQGGGVFGPYTSADDEIWRSMEWSISTSISKSGSECPLTVIQTHLPKNVNTCKKPQGQDQKCQHGESQTDSNYGRSLRPMGPRKPHVGDWQWLIEEEKSEWPDDKPPMVKIKRLIWSASLVVIKTLQRWDCATLPLLTLCEPQFSWDSERGKIGVDQAQVINPFNQSHSKWGKEKKKMTRWGLER